MPVKAWFLVVWMIEPGCATWLPLGYIFDPVIGFTRRKQWEGGNRKKNLRKEISYVEGCGYGGEQSENGRVLIAWILDH